jgi:hypothetical protein
VLPGCYLTQVLSPESKVLRPEGAKVFFPPARGILRRDKCNKRDKGLFARAFCVFRRVRRCVQKCVQGRDGVTADSPKDLGTAKMGRRRLEPLIHTDSHWLFSRKRAPCEPDILSPPPAGGVLGTTYNKVMFSGVFCAFWVQQEVQRTYNVMHGQREFNRG